MGLFANFIGKVKRFLAKNENSEELGANEESFDEVVNDTTDVVEDVEFVNNEEVVVPSVNYASEDDLITNLIKTKYNNFLTERHLDIISLKARANKSVIRQNERWARDIQAIQDEIKGAQLELDAWIELTHSSEKITANTAKNKVVEYKQMLGSYYAQINDLNIKIENNKRLLDVTDEEYAVCLLAEFKHRILKRLRASIKDASQAFDIDAFNKAKFNREKDDDKSLQTKVYTKEELSGAFIHNKKFKFGDDEVRENIIAVMKGTGEHGALTQDSSNKLSDIYAKLKKKHEKLLHKDTELLNLYTMLNESANLDYVTVYKELTKKSDVETYSPETLRVVVRELLQRNIVACKNEINLTNQVLTLTEDEIKIAFIDRVSKRKVKEANNNLRKYDNIGYKEFKNAHIDGMNLVKKTGLRLAGMLGIDGQDDLEQLVLNNSVSQQDMIPETKFKAGEIDSDLIKEESDLNEIAL